MFPESVIPVVRFKRKNHGIFKHLLLQLYLLHKFWLSVTSNTTESFSTEFYKRSIEPYFLTINSRIQEVHVFWNAWPFIVQPFLPFPRQSCPVERLPVSRLYPKQKIIEENKISSEEIIDKNRGLSCPLQTIIPITW